MNEDPKVGCAESPPPEPEPLTRQQAGARVARGVIAMLEDAIAATEVGLEKAEEGVAKENERQMLHAARSLRAALELQARRFERPRILRLDRARKIVRS